MEEENIILSVSALFFHSPFCLLFEFCAIILVLNRAFSVISLPFLRSHPSFKGLKNAVQAVTICIQSMRVQIKVVYM